MDYYQCTTNVSDSTNGYTNGSSVRKSSLTSIDPYQHG